MEKIIMLIRKKVKKEYLKEIMTEVQSISLI